MKIGIIEYGMGNLRSVKNAFDFLNCDNIITSNKVELSKCDALILPGVGAFPDAMKCLKDDRIDDFIRDEAAKKPLLGICLGMQLLFDRSYEFKICDGLGLIHGEIVKIEANGLKIPHMGWNELKIQRESKLLTGINDKSQVYFVHSFMAKAENRQDIICTTDYGIEIPAIVGRNNIYGCQFHPEKSSDIGLRILQNFRSIVYDYTSGN